MTDEIPPDDVLPCGCVLRCAIVDGVRYMTYVPCRVSCPHYLNMLDLAAQRGVPVEYHRAP